MDDSSSIPQKLCNKCLQKFPATHEYFVTGKLHKNGLRPLCKECRRMTRKDRKSPPVPRGYKRCSRCKKDLPANREFFGYRSRTKDHLYEYCHECTKAIGEEQKALPPLPNKPEIMACPKCGREKPFTLDFFYKNSRAPYKLSRVCQECQGKQGKQYRKEHAQDISERMKRYHQIHKYYLTDTYKAWREANRERIREQGRQRRLANPEPSRTYKRRFRQTEHGRLQHRAEQRIRETRKKNIDGSYTAQDIQRQYKAQKGKCYWCHQKLTKYHVDHLIPVTRAGSSNNPWNLVLACPTCNISRHNRLPHEWPKGGRLL